MNDPSENAILNIPKTCAVCIPFASAAQIERSTVTGVMKHETEIPVSSLARISDPAFRLGETDGGKEKEQKGRWKGEGREDAPSMTRKKTKSANGPRMMRSGKTGMERRMPKNIMYFVPYLSVICEVKEGRREGQWRKEGRGRRWEVGGERGDEPSLREARPVKGGGRVSESSVRAQ